MLIKSIKFNKFMRLSGGFSDGRRYMQMNQKASAAMISFVKTKRHRAPGARAWRAHMTKRCRLKPFRRHYFIFRIKVR
jgi:hypothetical protein